MSMYGPAAIAAALQEMGSGPGSMEDRMARALHAANSHLDYDALVDAGIAAQNAMDDAFWDQVGPVFGHDQAAYDRAVGNRRRVEAMVLLAGAGFPVDLPPVEGTGFPREGRDIAGAAYAVCSSALLETLRELADPDFRRRWDLGEPIGPADAVAQYTRDELPAGWPQHAAPPALGRSVLRAATTEILAPSSGAGFTGDELTQRLVARALPAACAAMQRAGRWPAAGRGG